jgi:predicted RND superfamily exporter protein
MGLMEPSAKVPDREPDSGPTALPLRDTSAAADQVTLSDRLAGWVVAARWWGLTLGAALWLLTVLFPPAGSVGRSVEQLFGTQDPSVADYQQIKAIFGDRETVLVVYRDRELFDPSGRGLQRLRDLAQSLAELPQVEEVLSLDRLEGTLRLISALVYPGSTAEWALLDPQNEIARNLLTTFDGWTHRRDNDLAVLVCLLGSPAKQANPDQTRQTIAELRRRIDTLPEAHVVGEPVMVEDALEYLRRDGLWLQFGSMTLLGLVILLVLRTIKWLLVAAVVVGWSQAVTSGLLAVLGFQQSMISSLLGSIITVIGVATTVHLVVRYRMHRAAGDERQEAMRRTMVGLLPPIFWACLTDAAGFASLAIARVSAVQEFGLMMGLASLVTLASVCLLAPGLILWGPRDLIVTGGLGQSRVESGLATILHRVRRHPGWVCGVTLLGCGVASSGFYFARVETDFTKNFRPGTPILAGYHFAENEFGGAGLIEIAVRTPPALERRFLERIADFQDRLRGLTVPPDPERNTADNTADNASIPGEPALAKVISLVDVWLVTRQFAALRLLPPDTVVSFMRQVLPQFTNHWYQWDAEQKRGYLRLFARTKQQQPAAQKRALIQQIQGLAAETFGDAAATDIVELPKASRGTPPATGAEPADATPPVARSAPPYLVSGLFVLLSRIVDSLLDDHLLTTTVAVGSIAALMYLALGSLRLAIIGMLPNILPIFVLLGGLGWLGVPINMGVAMIAAVSIGLSVDSSIHYLWVVAQGGANGRGGESQAIGWAQQRIGTALTYSTVALVVGFVSLTSSQFVPTIYFGGLVSAAMLGGWFGNVVLLPALLALSGPPTAEEGNG